MIRRSLLLLLCCSVLVLSGCVAPEPTPKVSPLQSPAPASTVTSPVSTPDKPADTGAVVQFQLDRPVKAGSTVVTGQGPAGVPVTIVSVTTMGNELGAGVIGVDNRFSISVAPLESSVRIGIAIGDLTGTNFTVEQFDADAYKGTEALMAPMVGYFLDTTMVQP